MNDKLIFHCIKTIPNTTEQLETIINLNIELPSKLAPYLLYKSFSIINLDIHLLLLQRTDTNTLTSIIPGLFSQYFRILSDDKIREELRKHIHRCIIYILEQCNKIDEISKQRIANFFYFYQAKEVKDLFIQLNKTIKYNEKILIRMIKMELALTEKEYKILNRYIRESECNEELIYLLLKQRKYEYNESIFDELKKKYLKNNKNKIVKQIISMIQTQFYDIIKIPIIELLPINTKSIEEILKIDDITKIEMFFKQMVGNGNSNNLIFKKYELPFVIKILECPSESQYLKSIFPINEIVRENYDILLNYIGENINIRKIELLRKIIEIEKCYKLDDILKKILKLFHDEILINKTNYEIMNNNCGDIKSNLLYTIKVIIKQKVITNETMRFVLEDLLYVDGYKILIYNIYTEIFGIYSKEDDIKELAALIWDNLILPAQRDEYNAVLKLLTSVIKATGNFYQSRIQKSGIIEYLFKPYKIENYCALYYNRYKILIEYMRTITVNLKLNKKYFEVIFKLCLELYIFFKEDCDSIFKLLEIRDKYFYFFLVQSVINESWCNKIESRNHPWKKIRPNLNS
ncbi:hypothetical protein TCON_2659 [Astathelohania contejeani]|uniref:Symplekin C-terminal domain-containing protein n=1 Tax=Astathelohania contejeani TaxID=164912 RepID=A0ABQ7HVD9_9MICR|nr:hypothetical protein TCON_2659 [Thelohania contejeani]